MSAPGGEMPFLDHLEELRGRLVKALGSVAIGFGLGLWLVQRFQLVSLLKEPIAPYLASTGGRLAVLSPTDPVMIVLKLGFVAGLVFASPIVIYQVWAFLSPALYERERKAVVPALGAGLVLFLSGGALGYFYLLPQALRVLFSFQSDALALVITYSEYFSFVMQIVLAMGISFELPLVLIILAALGIVSSMGLHRFRRFAVVLCMFAGAILSPGTDILSMIMMTIPLLLLYEVGFVGAWLIERRRRRAAAAALLLLALLGFPREAHAQNPVPPNQPRPPSTVPLVPGDTVPPDSTRLRTGQPIDTATARRLGLPTGPARSFEPDDSVLADLMSRELYEFTRYRADSVTLFADTRRIFLDGAAMTKRGTTTVEADTILYQEADCLLRAHGHSNLFDRETVLSGGGGISYNTCSRRGVVTDALTSFKQGSTDWFIRGNLAQDSSASRLYASSSDITSCDLPEPHYHFQAKEVKWISKTIMVARPAVLYVRDVPILWLPFVFQDGRPGRRSGILIPRFGLNDIFRPNPGYNRQITNIGYYWVPNDYLDVTARLDWFSNRYVRYGASTQYRWLNRFLSGNLAFDQQRESTGSSSTNLRWDHRQNFDLNTSLNLTINYASNSTVINDNAIDPLLNTQQILSSANFTKRFGWGSVAIGGNRRQSLSDGSATMELPSLSISPAPLDISRDITWSPALTLTNDLNTNTPLSPTPILVLANGLIDTLDLSSDSRTTAFNLQTPFRIGGFTWQNSLSVTDQQTNGRVGQTGFRVPDPSTPDPTDSIAVSRLFQGDFSTAFNWETGVSLPTVFPGSWKLQPVVGIANASSSGPFMIRNRNTDGGWVQQGKRFNFSISSTPTFFGFFPGLGLFSRIRHSISPTFQYTYNPASHISAEYFRALNGPGVPLQLRTDPTQTISLGLSQNLEGKAKIAADDTTGGLNATKYRILGITTSALQYDFEQAKQPGMNGWRTQTITNTFQSDLLPSFNLTLTHDLWKGQVGFDSVPFDPFLQQVSAGFAVSSSTITSALAALGLAKKKTSAAKSAEAPPSSFVAGQTRNGRPSSFYTSDNFTQATGSRQFTANFNYTLSRSRDTLFTGEGVPSRQSLGFSTTFAPTALWTVSWSSLYNITDSRFESTVIRLERNLHEWRAAFNFTKNAGGNFAFFFSIYLTDLPDIKADYNQTTITR